MTYQDIFKLSVGDSRGIMEWLSVDSLNVTTSSLMN